MSEDMPPMDDELLAEHRRRRWNRFLKRAGIILGGLVAVLLLAGGVYLWRISGALERRIQAIRDAGEPVSMTDLVGTPIPANKNAAVYYRRARGDLRAIAQELKAVRESDQWPDGTLTPAQLQTVQRVMAAHPKVMPLIHQAASCSKLRFEVSETATFTELQNVNLNELQEYRSVYRYLADRCRMLVAEGHRDEAMEGCLLNFQIARQLECQPALVAHLITIVFRRVAINSANHVLRSGPVSDSMRDALSAELAHHDLTAAYRHALISERACGLASFDNMNLGRFWLTRGLWKSAIVYYLDMMDQQIALASQPYDEVLRAPPQPVAKPRTPWTVLADMVLPAIQATREATERNRAALRCLRIVNAITRIEQQGGEVTDLDDLKLPEQQTVDPFTGKPLRMKKLPAGWMVYSVGKNLEDDDGQIDDESDIGLGPVPQLKP